MIKLNYKRATLLIIIISTIFRIINSLILEISSLEAYNLNYALFPEFGYINSPPMLGWFIQLFTNNISSYNILIIRLTSLICGSLSLWIIFIIGRRVKNETAGFYSVLLFSLTIYFNTYGGLFLLKESVLTLFILLSLYFIIEGLVFRNQTCSESKILCNISLIMSGIFIGLATLSSFYIIALWPIIFVYAVLFRRDLFNNKEIYISFLISLLIITPYLSWNVNNNYISLKYFISEVEPITLTYLIFFIIIIFTLLNPFIIYYIINSIRGYNKQIKGDNKADHVIIFISLSLVILTLFLSLINSNYISALTLSILLLIFPATSRLVDKTSVIPCNILTKKILISKWFVLVFFLFIYFYTYSPYLNFNISNIFREVNLKEYDFKEYGKWKKISLSFKDIIERDIDSNKISKFAFILEFNPFNASRIDFFFNKIDYKIDIKTYGDKINTLTYYNITEYRGGINEGDSAFMIYNTIEDIDYDLLHKLFEKVEHSSSIKYYSNKQEIAEYKILRLIHYKK